MNVDVEKWYDGSLAVVDVHKGARSVEDVREEVCPKSKGWKHFADESVLAAQKARGIFLFRESKQKGRGMKTKKIELPNITNVDCSGRGIGDGTVGLGCRFEDARYHIWMHPVTLDPGEILYKNALVARDHQNYFNTRRLKTSSQFSQGLIAAMLEVYKRENLLSKLEAKEIQDEVKRKAENEAVIRGERIKEAAPELLAALKAILPLALEMKGTKNLSESERHWIEYAKVVLEKVGR